MKSRKNLALKSATKIMINFSINLQWNLQKQQQQQQRKIFCFTKRILNFFSFFSLDFEIYFLFFSSRVIIL